jgi:hypothetical protein
MEYSYHLVEKSWSVALLVRWIVKMEIMIRTRDMSIVRTLVTARREMVNAILEEVFRYTSKRV